MDRTTAVNRHYANSLRRKLLELMEVIRPGESTEWGAKKHADLIGLAACQLALEYEALTGYPIVEMMNDAGATTAPAIEMPPKPLDVAATTETSSVVPIPAATTDDEVLPL